MYSFTNTCTTETARIGACPVAEVINIQTSEAANYNFWMKMIRVPKRQLANMDCDRGVNFGFLKSLDTRPVSFN